MALTKDQIFAAKFERLKRVAVPEWGGEVWVKAMSANERDEFEATHREIKESGVDPMRQLRARLAAATVCDESGVLLFSADDVAELGQHPAGPLDRVAEVAMDLCGMTKKDAAQLVAELKNGQAVSSPTA